MKSHIYVDDYTVTLELYEDDIDILLKKFTELNINKTEVNVSNICNGDVELIVKEIDSDQYTFLIEYNKLKNLVAFIFNKEGVEYLSSRIELLRKNLLKHNLNIDHEHFFTKEWAGWELTSKGVDYGYEIINELKLYVYI